MKIGKQEYFFYEIKEQNRSSDFRDISFYLGNKLMSEEQVYIPSYTFRLEQVLEKLQNHKFRNKSLDKLPPNQIFKKLADERNTNEVQYFNHLFQLDETIDQYTIFFIEKDNILLIAWSCWDVHNCNSDHSLNEIYWIKTPIDNFIATIGMVILELKK